MIKNKQKKILLTILFIFAILLMCKESFAYGKLFKEVEYTQEYKRWLELSEEERQGLIQPRMYEITKSRVEEKNPIKLVKMLKSSTLSRYSLKEDIQANVVVKNQMNTNSCWTFGALSSLETNLALSDFYNNRTAKVYDFSERHMEYATTRVFANGEENKNGFNRKVGEGGHAQFYIPYLTNGLGAVAESDMPFENNENIISLSEIQNNNVISQVYDTIEFPSYNPKIDDITEIKKQMKEHIKNYGSIEVGIHGANPVAKEKCYNNKTGAIYCNDSSLYPINHSVSVIGWDDDYAIGNFNTNTRPTSKGAWIIKNSWGTEIECITISEYRKLVFEGNKEYCLSQGWNSPEEIPLEVIKEVLANNGYTEEDGFKIVGDSLMMTVRR